MSNTRLKELKSKRVIVTTCGSPARRLMSFMVLLAGVVLLAVAVHAYAFRIYNGKTSTSVRTASSGAMPLPQASPKRPGTFSSRLSHQPQAERVRRSLGPRFLGAGRERTILTGTLIIGTDRSPVRIVRTQSDDGEQVDIGIGAGGSALTWNSTEGARVDARPAVGNSRAIIERLALDTPDEFVLAQLRGASYYTVAFSVMPKSAAGSEDYTGPTWDVVRVGEPDAAGTDATLSKARSFHINTSTGLIDRIFSQEEGETIVAEISGWVDRSGDKSPSRITWSRNGQMVMELTLNNIANGPKQ